MDTSRLEELGPTPESYTVALSIARPIKDKSSGIYRIRLKVPADIRSQVGKVEVGKSLQTRDPAEAKKRWAEAYLGYQREWAAVRNGPVAIPHRQLVALAGHEYRELMDLVEEEPGEPSIWRNLSTMHDTVGASQENLQRWYGALADKLLREKGLNADATSYQRLLVELHRAHIQWRTQQLKRSEGDYSPDPDAGRFPAWKEPEAPQRSPVSLSGLFALWERDHLADGKTHRTVTDFRHKIEALISHLGHDDAETISESDIAEWCDHLRHSIGLSARTVSQKYLAAVKLIFSVGVQKRKLATNPAKDVTVRFGKRPRSRPKGFTDAEAEAILKASLANPDTLGRRTEENKRAIRWGPWICAFTGARITEAMQLRREDLVEEGGALCLRITPDAGSVKSGSFRLVPLHPQLIAMGLIAPDQQWRHRCRYAAGA